MSGVCILLSNDAPAIPGILLADLLYLSIFFSSLIEVIGHTCKPHFSGAKSYLLFIGRKQRLTTDSGNIERRCRDSHTIVIYLRMIVHEISIVQTYALPPFVSYSLNFKFETSRPLELRTLMDKS